MAMQNPQDLFLHELGDIYDAEQRFAKMIPMLAKETRNDQFKSALQQHEQETRQQIQNLEQAFQILGSQPKGIPCHAVMGLEKEHESFLKENPSEDVLMLYGVGASAKSEHYEIACYRGLVEKSKMMGQQDLTRLLQENLQQEEAMAKRVEQMGQQLGQQVLGQMGMAQQMGQQPGQQPSMPD